MAERLRYAQSLDAKPYLYVDKWESEPVINALEQGYCIAIHPHLYKPISRTADAVQYLGQRGNSRVELLPDTAHLWIAGEDLLEVLNARKEWITAIHLKDWSPDFGRSSHRYARGFVELGEGILGKEGVLDAVVVLFNKWNDRATPRWLIVEQDSTTETPEASLQLCTNWLIHRGLCQKQAEDSPKNSLSNEPVVLRTSQIYSFDQELAFLNLVLRAASKNISACYDTIAAAFMRLLPCERVAIWACSPKQDRMSLLLYTPAIHDSIITSIPSSAALSGETVTATKPKTYDLSHRDTANKLAQKSLLKDFQSKTMISVPILNPWNYNHVRYVLNLFLAEPFDASSAESRALRERELMRFAHQVAVAVDCALDSHCASLQGRLAAVAAKNSDLLPFLSAVCNVTVDFLKCEGVAIFLLNERTGKLHLRSSLPSTKWSVPRKDQNYSAGEGNTGLAWQRREMIFAPHEDRLNCERGKSYEQVTTMRRHDCLFAPLVRSDGTVIGVMRLRNKLYEDNWGAPPTFSDDDAALLDALIQAAVPQIDLRRSPRKTVAEEIAWGVTYTLGSRASTLNAWLTFLQRDWGKPDRSALTGMEEAINFFKRASILSSKYFKASQRSHCEAICTQALIHAAVKALPDPRIHVADLKPVANVFVLIDRVEVESALLEMLENARNFTDAQLGFIEISAKVELGFVLIAVTDNGKGVMKDLKSRLFELFQCFPKDRMGLGLAYVRKVARKHGGDVVEISANDSKGAHFVLSLPCFTRSTNE